MPKSVGVRVPPRAPSFARGAADGTASFAGRFDDTLAAGGGHSILQWVKILRRILIGVVLTVVLAGLLVGLAFVPAVQTWYAQSKLDAREDVHGTVGSLSAGLHRVELADLHLEIGAVVIDVPSLQASLPVTSAAWKHDVRIGSLVAKGWTIDLSRTLEPEKVPAQPTPAVEPAKAAGTAAGAPATATASAETPEVQQALKILRSIVGGQALPCDLSLDGVEVASGRIEQTVPFLFSMSGETLDVGVSTGSSVGPYPVMYRFSGTIKKIDVELLSDMNEELAAAFGAGQARGALAQQ